MTDDNAAHVSGGDQNKTRLTLDVTAAASAWLDKIGAKPVEAEVTITTGWIADLAGIWSPTRTEAADQHMIPRALPWKSERGARAKRSRERNKLYHALPHTISIVHEVKVTRSDFRRDHKWSAASPADMRVLSIVTGVAADGEWPAGWWVLLHDATTGAVIKVAHRAPMTPVTCEQRFNILMQISLRRHNRTQYAYLRDIMRHQNDQENDRINKVRFSYMAQLMIAVQDGRHDTVEACVARYVGRRWKVPPHLMDELRAMHGKAKEDEQTDEGAAVGGDA